MRIAVIASEAKKSISPSRICRNDEADGQSGGTMRMNV